MADLETNGRPDRGVLVERPHDPCVQGEHKWKIAGSMMDGQSAYCSVTFACSLAPTPLGNGEVTTGCRARATVTNVAMIAAIERAS